MKTVYVDILLDGHHLPYLQNLVYGREEECVLILPHKVPGINCKQYTFRSVDMHHKKIWPFYRWTKEVMEFLKEENPKIVHFLTGDIFYKFFGLGLWMFRKYNTLLTFHWLREDILGMLSTKRICKQVSRVIVHTSYILEKFAQNGIDNAVHIEYPQFDRKKMATEAAKEKLRIPVQTKVIGCIGGTRYDKGLDILLKALTHTTEAVHLLIAGKEETFTESYIQENTEGYAENVHMMLKHLSDEELEIALNACDVIVLPYRKAFTGASGPLSEGVWLKKAVIAPDCGSLGEIVRKNDIGVVFEAENPLSLASKIDSLVKNGFTWSERAERYAAGLSPTLFHEHYLQLYVDMMNQAQK